MQIEVESTKFSSVTARHIRRVLKCISQGDLEGLHSIKVIDECPDDPEYTNVQPYLRGFRYNGHYSRKVKGEPARVVLYAHDVYYGVPKFLIATPVATLKLGRTLAHEVGHHVIANRGYIYQPWEKYKQWNGRQDPYAEKMADSYAAAVLEEMLKHWPYKLGQAMAKMISNFLYNAGIQDYWDGDYQSSALLLDRAYSLDRENEDAGQCYRHAIEKLKNQTPSPLTDAEREWLTKRYDPTPLASSAKSHTKKHATSNKHRRRAQKSIQP